jgi:arylsulfatase
MAMAWPARIKDAGGVRSQFHHVIDIVPTILEATGIQAPVMVNGVAQKPIEGVSMAYSWDNAQAPSARTSSISRCSATVRSTTTAGLPPRRRPQRLG